MRGGGEEVPVIGIDFPKPVFCRAREMEGVGGAQRLYPETGKVSPFDSLEHSLAERKKRNCPFLAVEMELIQHRSQMLWCSMTLPDLAMTGRNELRAAVDGT